MISLEQIELGELKNKRLFEFVVTGPKVDKEGDTVPMEEIDKALLAWIMRGGQINEGHSNIGVGRGLTFNEDNEGNRVAIGLINEDSKVADMAWDKIKSGEYGMVSIGGGAFKKTPNEHGGEDLRGLEVLEVSLCAEGMYPDANILSKNEMAKGSPFFAKAVIKRPVTINKLINQSAGDAVIIDTVSTGDPTISSWDISGNTFTNVTNGGNEMSKGVVNKPEGMYASVEDLQAVMARVQELESMVSAAPADPRVAAAADEEDEELPGTKETEDEEKTNKTEENLDPLKEPGVGVEIPKPDEEGGEVTLPKTVEDKREPQNEPGDQPSDDREVVLTEKNLDSLVNKALKKKGITFSDKPSTPIPVVEKGHFNRKEEIPSWEIIKETKTLSDYVKNSEIMNLERELGMRKAFEAERGGA